MTINRQPQGIPVGGQFAATAHSEAAISLTPIRPTYRAPLTGVVELNPEWFEKLPVWPEDLPEPEVNFGFDDGRAETYVTVDGKMMTFWNTDHGIINDTANGSNPWDDFDIEDAEKAEEWGKAVHNRIDSATYGVMIEGAHSPAVKNIILAQATDKGHDEVPTPNLEDEATRNAYVIEASRRVGEAQRELQRVYMIGAAQEIRASFPEIGSFELTVGDKHLEISVAYDNDGDPLPNHVIGKASNEVFRYRNEDDFNTFLDGQIVVVDEALRFRPRA